MPDEKKEPTEELTDEQLDKVSGGTETSPDKPVRRPREEPRARRYS